MNTLQLNTENSSITAHLYSLGVSKNGVVLTIEVHANTRASAAKIAKLNGYEVRDVNMIG